MGIGVRKIFTSQKDPYQNTWGQVKQDWGGLKQEEDKWLEPPHPPSFRKHYQAQGTEQDAGGCAGPTKGPHEVRSPGAWVRDK